MASKKSGGTPPKKSVIPAPKQPSKVVEKRHVPAPAKKSSKGMPGKGIDMQGVASEASKKKGGGGTEDGGYSVSPGKSRK